MRILSGKEEAEARGHMERAGRVALLATCERSRCGAVIVKDGGIIAEGFNSPPKNQEDQRRCQNDKALYDKKVTDKTCCMHAEERAILAAFQNASQKINESALYFIRLDRAGKRQYAGKPYCTLCSKLALDAGIAEFVLWHEGGITSYPTDEYNDLSFEFRGAGRGSV